MIIGRERRRPNHHLQPFPLAAVPLLVFFVSKLFLVDEWVTLSARVTLV